jgi:hypothetical protein
MRVRCDSESVVTSPPKLLARFFMRFTSGGGLRLRLLRTNITAVQTYLFRTPTTWPAYLARHQVAVRSF